MVIPIEPSTGSPENTKRSEKTGNMQGRKITKDANATISNQELEKYMERIPTESSQDIIHRSETEEALLRQYVGRIHTESSQHITNKTSLGNQTPLQPPAGLPPQPTTPPPRPDLPPQPTTPPPRPGLPPQPTTPPPRPDLPPQPTTPPREP